MSINNLKAYLDERRVKYVTINHSSAYTSQEIAHLVHVSGKEFAKTVMITIDKKMAMAVLPASYQVDFEELNRIFVNKSVTLANEAEFKYRFPDCEIGAMPPFGNLYGLEVFVAESLTEDEEIAFNAGTHSQVIKMKYDDFNELVQPQVFKFSWKTVSFPNDPAEKWETEV